MIYIHHVLHVRTSICVPEQRSEEKKALRVLLRVLDGDCLGLKIGESSLGTKLPACSRLLETSERCLKKTKFRTYGQTFLRLERIVVVVVVVVVGMGGA